MALWDWLLSEEGETAIRQAAAFPAADELKKLTFLREKRGFSPNQAARVMEQVRLREKAAAKFGEAANRMILTPVGLEQATDQWIAAYKAARFPAGKAVADICCGIGGDLAALAQNHPVLGVDRDPITAAAAKRNLKIFSSVFEQNLLKSSFNDKKQESLKKSSLKGGNCSEIDFFSEPKTANFVMAKKGQNTDQKVSTFLNVKKEDFDAKTKRNSTEFQLHSVETLDAETFLEKYPPETFPFLHLDPDRRSDGVRTTQMSYFEPGLDVVERLLEGREIAAVKLAPGTEVPETWKRKASELEWIGRDRECRQLLVWFRKNEKMNADAPCRATILEAHSSRIHATVLGQANEPIPVAEVPGRFLFDVDSTVLAAGLEGTLARQFGLKRIGEGSLYLTGDEAILTEGSLSCFEILRILPLDRRQLVKEIQERQWGSVEIKKRGNVPAPEEVRKWLKFQKKGTKDAKGTLVLAQTGPKSVAIITNRLS